MSGDVLVLERPTELATNDDDLQEGGAEASMTEASESSPANRHESTQRGAWADYWELTKPRIVMMILIVTGLAAIVAAGRDLQWLVLLHLMLGTCLVAGSAGTLNQVIEKEVDGRMRRTRNRPVPTNRVPRGLATGFGFALITIGTAYLFAFVGVAPAWVGLVTWFLYVAIYTPMKLRSSWNTTVGAIAGALPMQMGYTAAGGSIADYEGWLLFGVLFLWQYPHFMAIAWMYRHDYGAAGLQMTTVVEPSGRSAGLQAVLGTFALGLVSFLLCLLLIPGWLGGVLGAIAVGVTFPFIAASLRFARQPDDQTARRLLRASLLQLPAAMAVLVIAALV